MISLFAKITSQINLEKKTFYSVKYPPNDVHRKPITNAFTFSRPETKFKD